MDVARQRRKQADVREPARESRDRRLRDVEAEALVGDTGAGAHEHRTPPVRAEGQPDRPRSFAPQPEREDPEDDEKRRSAERHDPGEPAGENRPSDQELREQESLGPQGVTETARGHPAD